MPEKPCCDESKKSENGKYNRKRMGSAVQRRLDFERLVAGISSEFAGIRGDSIDPAIDRALAAIGSFTGADRAYIFRFKNGDTRVDNTNEWCAEGVEAQIDNLKDIRVDEELPWFTERIRKREVLHVPDVAALPPEALLERRHFEAQQIQSLIVVPMETAERLIGFLGFDAVRERRTWSDDDKALLQFFGQTLSNVIERKRIEEALRESEEKYRTILDNIEDGYYEVDLAGNFTFFNDSLCRNLGYSRSELMGMNNREYMDQKNAEKVFQTFNQVVTTGKPARAFDWELIKKDGARRHVDISVSLIRDTHGNVTGFRGIARDITDKKLAEKVLRESEEKYKLLAENAADVIYKIGIETEQCTYASPSIEGLLGYNSRESLSLKAHDILTPESYAKQKDRLLKAIEKGRIGHETLELEAVHKDGHILPIEINVKLLFDKQGNPVEILGVARDIKERKLAEAQIRHMATHDELTELPSLKLAKDRLSMALSMAGRQKEKAAIMFIDADDLKKVNDTFGHDAGDTVLKQLAQRLLSCVRNTDTVARVGGDEFLLIATGLNTLEDAGVIAEKIIKAESQPFIFDGQQAAVGVSIGIALFPDHGEDKDRLIKLADEAMYIIKNSGKNGYSFASPPK